MSSHKGNNRRDDDYDSYDELFTQHLANEVEVRDITQNRTPGWMQSHKGSTSAARESTNTRNRLFLPMTRHENNDPSSITLQAHKLPWAQQYSPTNLDELAVHKGKVSDVQNWLLNAFAGTKEHKLLILRGPAGSGKTTTIKMLSQTLGFDMHEWKNPPVSEFAKKDYLSIATQFEEFLGRGDQFRMLDLDGPNDFLQDSNRYIQRRIILIEEFPTLLHRGSSSLAAFQLSLQRYLAMEATLPSNGLNRSWIKPQANSPIVIIVSETHLTSYSSSENLTVHRLLGPELFNHPGTTIIDFNSIAPTFMCKAMKLILEKEAHHSGRSKDPGPAILQSISRSGDIRSAVASLEFLCLDVGRWGIPARRAKKPSRNGVILTPSEKETLNLVTQREASLGIFHAVGKIVYNKRGDTDVATEGSIPPSPPKHIWHHDRPKVSQVPVNELMEVTGTDIQTFISALHENYVPSCDGSSFVDCVDACIVALSDSDMLCVDHKGPYRNRTNRTSAGVDVMRQEDISYQVAARGLLFGLPHPVKRRITTSTRADRSSDAHKMLFPSTCRLMQEAEAVRGLTNIWVEKLLKSFHRTTSGLEPGLSASLKNCNPDRVEYYRSDQAGIATMIPRQDLVLYHLPYLTKIHHNEVEIAQLRRITGFHGAVCPHDSLGNNSNGERLSSASTSQDISQPLHSTDLKSNLFGPKLPPSYKQEEEKLMLSDDDIVDDFCSHQKKMFKQNAGPLENREVNDHLTRRDKQKESHVSLGSITTVAAYAAFPGWTTIALMVSLIFGGCCTNVAFFVTVNLLNNWAFAYKISVPLHIILRSGGPVASMIVGYTFNAKKYSHGQILAVAMLTTGVIVAALADASTKGRSISVGYHQNDSTLANTLIGFSILALAMVLSAFQGIYADRLYEDYGRNHWKEALFYSHTLSLPLFLPTFSHLLAQWRTLLSSPSLLSEVSAIAARKGPVSDSPILLGTGLVTASRTAFIKSVLMPIINATTYLLVELGRFRSFQFILACIPIQVFYLLMNAFTQYLCIRGVHLLSAKSSSLTVTIVLNVRKLISLLLSIYLFGNDLASGVLMGAIFVFAGGALYGFEGARLRNTYKSSTKKD
ncbi:Rad17 cell cycle checkpoint protein-domain-containing protein [Aspergillus bertholletiae]|uniref:Rad17 cell cycle checkpoint protein-domain-containing protein n=1 Tax=Aspergillus bertholletiae TaxID=1226010 RepID=A0A5N7B668_9EURO|nr:Rad17 cell cycle checkpoint protein-domain-containing protein [Aspergillus bertholletiae]